LANLGDISQEPAQRTEYLWPSNVKNWHHWQAVQTQWRSGTGGATGLDYAGVLAYLGAQGLKRPQRLEAFTGIQAAERATLEVWAEQARDAQAHKP